MSATLSADDLGWMRSLMTASLQDSCTISTPGAATLDAYGEPAAGAATDVVFACSFAPVTGREVATGGGLVEVGDYIVTLPANTVVAANATITVAARGAQAAHTFRVKTDLHTSDEIGTRVLCSEG